MADASDYILPGAETAGGVALLATGNPMGLPMTIAGIQGLAGTAKKSKAEKEAPPLEDPELRRFLNEIDRQRKSFETGSAYSSEMRELKNQQAATQQGVLRAEGGNVGAAVAAMERVGINTGMQYGKIAAEGQARQDMYTQMYGGLLDKIAQRKFGIQEQKYQQDLYDGKQNQIAGLQQGLNSASMSGNPGQSSLMDSLKKMFSGMGGTMGSGMGTTPPMGDVGPAGTLSGAGAGGAGTAVDMSGATMMAGV